MRFVSTRGQAGSVSFSEAVSQGLAPDGGLYLPDEFPDITSYLSDWENMSYPELCFSFFRLFASDIEENNLRNLVNDSYSRFSHREIAPIVSLHENLKILELFHGPTLAFKDFALQLLGNIYEEQIKKNGKPLTILGATSGDTGAAAIAGLLGKKGVTVFYFISGRKSFPITGKADDLYGGRKRLSIGN